MTASQLFAGKQFRHGDQRCYFCGAWCDDSLLAKPFVKDTFTNYDYIKFPQSKYICVGCAESLGQGPDEMDLVDGMKKIRENDRGMQPRMYSWVLTRDNRLAGTKTHIKQFREMIINPPEPPFSIILTDTGQKQLIFRAPVAMDQSNFPVLLEDEVIIVVPELLSELLNICVPVCAALGKPALIGEITVSHYIRYFEYHGEIETLERWVAIRSSPLSRLAAWLSKTREETQNEYPSIERREVSAGIGGSGRQKQSAARNGTGSDKGRDNQVLFDIG